MNEIKGNQNFNGLFYKIKDSENKTRGYLLGTIHKAGIEGTNEPKAFSAHLMKKFTKTESLILEIDPLQVIKHIPKSFGMDYELAIKAKIDNMENDGLESLEFNSYADQEYTLNCQIAKNKVLNEIIAEQVVSLGGLRKLEFFHIRSC